MKLVMGSRNVGKRAQIIEVLKPYALDLVMAEETDVPDPEETGTTFLENSLIKARAYSQGTQLPALADDSGLVIPALDGMPGIYSARYAAENGGYEATFKVLEEKLDGLDTTAYITSTVVLMWPDGRFVSGVGEIWGQLVFPPRQGIGGFAYYPIFCPEGHSKTLSEMSREDFAGINHRRKSMAALLAQVPELSQDISELKNA